jgi:hypothetical protein
MAAARRHREWFAISRLERRIGAIDDVIDASTKRDMCAHRRRVLCPCIMRIFVVAGPKRRRVRLRHRGALLDEQAMCAIVSGGAHWCTCARDFAPALHRRLEAESRHATLNSEAEDARLATQQELEVCAWVPVLRCVCAAAHR